MCMGETRNGVSHQKIRSRGVCDLPAEVRVLHGIEGRWVGVGQTRNNVSHWKRGSWESWRSIGRHDKTLFLQSPEVIISLHSTLVRPILEYCSPVWSPWTQKDINALDEVQRRCEKMCNTELKFQSLSECRNKVDLKETYKIMNNAYYLMDKDKLFKISESNSRGNSQKLYLNHNRPDIRKNFFSSRVIIPKWNKLPEKVVSAPNSDASKTEVEPYLNR